MTEVLAILGAVLASASLILHALNSTNKIVVDVEDVVDKVLSYLGQTGSVPAPTGTITAVSATAPLSK